jgi:hypothetical protein
MRCCGPISPRITWSGIRDLAAYFAAKRVLLTRAVGEVIFVGASVRRYAQQFGYGLAPSSVIDSEGQPPEPRLAGTVFAGYPQRENFELALAWWRHAGLRESADLLAAARSFRLGRHRLGCVAVIEGVTYWNDSKATNFHAVEAALARFAAPVFLIAGGKAKGGDLAAFVRRIAPRVKQAFLIGDTSPALAAACAAHGVPHTVCATLGGSDPRRRRARRPRRPCSAQPRLRQLRHVPRLRTPRRPVRTTRQSFGNNRCRSIKFVLNSALSPIRAYENPPNLWHRPGRSCVRLHPDFCEPWL